MASFLIDTSALARGQSRAEVRAVLDPLVLDGQVATCGIVDLEVLYSASSRASYRAAREALEGMPRVAVQESCIARALEVQGLLAARSQHRGVPLPDLLIAACAESAGLTVLHYDADYERIAKVTGQPVQWIVPRGSTS